MVKKYLLIVIFILPLMIFTPRSHSMSPIDASQSKKNSELNSADLTYKQENIKLKIQLETALKQVGIEQTKIKELNDSMRRIKAKAAWKTETYLVKRNESLWRIAKQADVYNDPYKWLILYHANRDQIYDPNLIYPNMVLLIPRINETEKDE